MNPLTLAFVFAVSLTAVSSTSEPVIVACQGAKFPENPTVRCYGVGPSAPLHRIFRYIKRGDLDSESAKTIHLPTIKEFIEALDINGAGFTVAADAFNGFTSLTALHIAKNGDGERPKIDKDALKNLSNLVHVTLDNVDIKDVVDDLLRPLKDTLKVLRLEHVPLNGVPAVLKEFTQLREIALLDTGITDIPAQAFKNSGSTLEQLWLHGNKIKTVTKDSFDGLSKVKLVSLRDNEIETIQPDTLGNLINLRGLNLACNKLQTLAPEVFTSTPNIYDLNIYGNPMEDKPDSAWNLQKLQVYASPREANYRGKTCTEQ